MLEKNKLWNALIDLVTFEALRNHLYLRKNKKLQRENDRKLERERLIQRRLAVLDG